MGRGPTKAKAGGGASALAGPRPRQYRPGGVIQGTGLACLELEPAPDPAGAGANQGAGRRNTGSHTPAGLTVAALRLSSTALKRQNKRPHNLLLPHIHDLASKQMPAAISSLTA